MIENKNFEAIIVGGSYAGLSAAMALGRSLRDTLIIDFGHPCNEQTPYSHNFLTQDGKTPSEISSLAREQVGKYDTIQFLSDMVSSGDKTSDGFQIKTLTGKEFFAKKLIFATGIKDLMPDIKGIAECWGITVIHCPYCHGYEFREQKTGILANGDRAFQLASMVDNLTRDLTILTNGEAKFSQEELAKLSEHNIQIVEKEVAEIEHENGHIRSLIFGNGEKRAFDAVYAALSFTQNSDIPASLGCEFTEQGHIKVDFLQRTSVESVFACGDNSTPFRSVANAVASGNICGAIVNKELVEEEF